MKLYIWTDSAIGGGFTLVVAATDEEMALSAIRNSEQKGLLNYIESFKVKPVEVEIVEIEYGKVVHYFEYYE